MARVHRPAGHRDRPRVGQREAKPVRQGSHGWDVLQSGTSLLPFFFACPLPHCSSLPSPQGHYEQSLSWCPVCFILNNPWQPKSRQPSTTSGPVEVLPHDDSRFCSRTSLELQISAQIRHANGEGATTAQCSALQDRCLGTAPHS